ncbi:hypothetical protein [Cellulosimicrobium funkei]|uniref:hypothetical protein n=1 Tax=Cellulosimicrobium funkei TaxID=264251 RepID=UPI0036BEC0DC
MAKPDMSDDFEDMSLDDIEEDVPRSASPTDMLAAEADAAQVHQRKVLEHRASMLGQDLQDRAQTHALRTSFARVIKWTMIATLGATALLMGFYLYAVVWRRTDVDSAVMIAWFSSTVVQVIGLVYIVANYLFPKSDNGKEVEPKP